MADRTFLSWPFFDDEHPDQHKSTVKLVEPELGDVEEGLYERFGEGEDEL